jgi:large subunit ribosomal protein L24
MKKIKKDDEVIVIAGKDKGRKGKVLQVLSATQQLLVEGVNTVKKHVRPNPNTGEKGGIVIKTLPIAASNIMLYDSASGKGSRVGIKILADGRKARYFKSTNELVDV